MDKPLLGILPLLLTLAAIITTLIVVGRRVSKGVSRRAPDSQFSLAWTPTGIVLVLCLVASWVMGMAAREWAPEGPLGRFLQDPAGLAAGWALSIFVFSLLAGVLAGLGSPITRKPGVPKR